MMSCEIAVDNDSATKSVDFAIVYPTLDSVEPYGYIYSYQVTLLLDKQPIRMRDFL